MVGTTGAGVHLTTIIITVMEVLFETTDTQIDMPLIILDEETMLPIQIVMH